MADQLQVIRDVSYNRGSGLGNLRANRDGAVIVGREVQSWIAEGFVHIVNFGADTTPIALETAYDADQPDLNLDVPRSKVVIPLYFEVSAEATGAAGFEAHLLVSPTQVGAGTSTAITPQNMRTDSPFTSSCTARRTYTGNGTDPSANGRWIANWSINQDLDATGIAPRFVWDAGLNGMGPMIVGGGSFNAYMYCGTSGTAFAVLIYAELPAEYITG